MNPPHTLVLVVEDDAEFRDLLVDALGDEPDLRVVAVTDAHEARRVLSTFRPRLVLLDIWLPEMNGAEFVRALRADPEQDGVPVVAMTAKGLTDLTREVEELGVRVLHKPFGVPELVAAVRQALAGGA